MYKRGYLCYILILGLILISILPVGAVSAADSKADALNKLSILQGSGGSYMLDSQLKRAEAAVFIVKLLGKQQNVIDNKSIYSVTGFPDVKKDAWYAPYVGYCSGAGIIGGNGDGKFWPESYISEKSFLRMVLSALGYEANVDYTWGTVYQLAYEIKLVTDLSYKSKTTDNTKYLRKGVVEVLYNSLSLTPKSKNVTQLQWLVNEGAITRTAAVQSGIFKDAVTTAISLVTPFERTKISVKFNEAVKSGASTQVKIYETADFTKLLTCSIESVDGSEIIIKTSEQVPERGYTLEITNLEDTEGNVQKNISSTFKGYKIVEVKSDFFKISKIEPVSKNMINVYFTHPINANSELPSYYEILENNLTVITGSTQNMIVNRLSSVNNAVTLFLKDKTLAEGGAYTIKVSGKLTSVYGVSLNEGAGDSMPFTGKGNETEGLKLINIQAINNRTLDLYFNREVNPVRAKQVFSYYITDAAGGPIQITNAAVAGEAESKGKCVRLTIGSVFDRTKAYSIMVNYIEDITKVSSISEKSYSFSGYYPDKTDLSIVNVSQVDSGTLVVYFSRPLSADSAGIASNFSVIGVSNSAYLAFPVKTYFDKELDPYMVKLYLPSDKLLEGSKSYKLRVLPTLQDSFGNTQSKMLELGFNSSSVIPAKPRLAEAVIIGSGTIRVTFSKEISLDVPNILNTNYSLEYVEDGVTITRIPTSVNYINPETIGINFDTLSLDKKYTLKANSIKDYAGNVTGSADSGSSIEVVAGK